ncbi:MAG: sigma-54-dependent Fis family transcriptional regulator [Deltaproteobacteria bacterium]|nr:sigma-54-dependent Fis family transcriptional regulator [Deltaproteobacteria bacterium]
MEPASILIVDDERVICNGCRVALMDEDYSVDICMNGRSGLNAILKGHYDVVLLDMKLPDVGGIEILKGVAKEKPGEHIIVMTGHFSVQNAVEAMKSGAFDYLTKPFSDDELFIAVKKALESKRLKEENLSLRQQLAERFNFSNIIGKNNKILKIFEGIQKVAPTDSTVLLCGESGTGKELFARAIHAHSKRAAARFVAVDCSTFSPSLLESELFGHVKGAFTGAIKDKAGIFEMASHGSLFLDEVANLDMTTQAKLLRALETHEFMPVGGNRLKKSDVRIIGATNRDLKAMVEKNEFREDFFYRLNVFPVFIPPLRERKDDIPRLLYHFLRSYCHRVEKRVDGFSDDALAYLINHDWPGNVRQLKNVVERLVIMTDDRILEYGNLTDHLEVDHNPTHGAVPETLDELKNIKQDLLEKQFGQIERAFLQKALSGTQGNITRASKRVGMQRSNFSALMKKHHLSAHSPERN